MILVFKTSTNTKKKVKSLSPFLNNLLQISHWNFDLDDCDYILRVESQINVSEQIIRLLNDKGFECTELDD